MLIGGAMNVVEGDAVAIPTYNGFSNFATLLEVPQVYSGVRFGSDGDMYRANDNGSWSRFGTWLLEGTASNYYIARTITSGDLSTGSDAGDNVQLNANRDYYVIDDSPADSSVPCSVQFSITDNGGSTVYAGPKIYSFSAFLDTGE